MVLKKDGKLRMYVDYRDLNKASPKDNFPLSHIDVIVNIFFFVDGFSRYPDGAGGSREDLIHHPLRHSRLQIHAIWSNESRDHISEGENRVF